jgi:hypothetical protein
MKQQQEMKYAYYETRKPGETMTPPVLDFLAQVPPQFLPAAPRTALATAKRREAERAKNPDIPFKLSHMGNTLYTPAMMDPPVFKASDMIAIVPVKRRGGVDGGGESERGLSSTGSRRDGGHSSSGAKMLESVARSARRFGEYPTREAHALNETGPREKREQLRPTTSQESTRQQMILAFDTSRPCTAASGLRTRSATKSSSSRLPKHIAILTTPRKEDQRKLERSLKQTGPSQILAAQPQNKNEIIPTGVLLGCRAEWLIGSPGRFLHNPSDCPASGPICMAARLTRPKK